MSDDKMKIEFVLPEGIQSKPNTITLSVGGKDKIKINETGFYVDNVLVENDRQMYNHFKMWLDLATKEEIGKNGGE